LIEDEIGRAFEGLFCPEEREFEQAKLQKFKCPGVGRMLNFRIDRRITPLVGRGRLLLENMQKKPLVKKNLHN